MKVKELIDSILKNEISFFEIVQYIETNSTDSSRDLLLTEIYGAFKMKSLDFMFEVKDEDIKDAINQFDHNLEYFYLSDEDKLKVQHFIKEIDNKLTIFNVGGFSKVADPKKLKVIYLNNLMIEYHDGFFQHEIKGFENLSHFKSICESLKEHFEKPKEKIEVQPIQIDYANYQKDNFKDLLLVEELEKRVAIEAVEYKKNCDDYWETYTFDPTYFDTFISGELYTIFLNAIYERIKPLNDFEINKYLTLSVNQFKTHTPTKRADIFKRIYNATYWYPNYMEYEEYEYETKYVMHVWKHYTNHFHLFKEASENMLQDFKKGLIGSGRKQEVFEKPKTKPKSKHQSFTYKKWQFESTNLTYLKESLIDKKLIASDTELKHFRKVFSGEEIEKPIIWTGNISELSYFIKQLHNELKLVENLKQQQWAVTINCFVQENGEQYNRTKLRTQKVPTTSKNIDMALKTL
jgi:ribosomal protein S21